MKGESSSSKGVSATKKASSLRWAILRRALLPPPPPHSPPHSADEQSEMDMKHISRKTNQGFNLIPCHVVESTQADAARETCVCYTLPIQSAPQLFLLQRVDSSPCLDDFRVCNTYDIDNTGLVCPWPSEEVLAYYCLSNVDLFRSKKVMELGSGYGLAGLVIAMATEALEVWISDGNPQVVDYIQRNIDVNSCSFGGTRVKSMMLHWNQDELSDISNNFDIIVASDCTFFKESHQGLVHTIKCLLRKDGPSEAIFFSPKRGNSLDEFLLEVKSRGLNFMIDEIYDTEIWRRHQGFIHRADSWPNYEMDHCYPLLIRITL